MRSIYITVGLLLFAGFLTYSSNLAQTYEYSNELTFALSLLSYVSYALAAVSVIPLILNIAQLVKSYQPIEEAKPIENAMNNLTTLLTQIRPNTEQADVKLQDAKMYSEVLGKLIIGLVDKAEEFKDEESVLRETLEAISTGETSKIKLMAGKINDATIRQFLLSHHITGRSTYQSDVIGLISFEIGVLRNWQQGYDKFATSLFAQLGDIQGKLKSLEAGKDFMIATKPILQIQTNLLEASNVLQLKSPGVRIMMREALPQVSNHLLKG